MKSWIDWLKSPTTITSILVFAFTLWGTYFSINARLNALEEFKNDTNIVEIQKSIIAIQKDIEWIKINMPSKYGN